MMNIEINLPTFDCLCQCIKSSIDTMPIDFNDMIRLLEAESGLPGSIPCPSHEEMSEFLESDVDQCVSGTVRRCGIFR